MPDELIIGLTLLIVVLTVIGLALYGLIALIARLFGGRARLRKDRRRCAFCGKMTPSNQDRCDWCSRDLRSPLAEELTDLDALQRQLQRFRDGGALKPAAVTNLLARVEHYRRGLIEPPTERPAAAPIAVAPASRVINWACAIMLGEKHQSVSARRPAS